MFAFILTAAMVLSMIAMPASADHVDPEPEGADHCPGANQQAPDVPEEYQPILVNNDQNQHLYGDDYVPADGDAICIKTGQDGDGGGKATGIFIVDNSDIEGSRTLLQWLQHLGYGSNVSYFMQYTPDEPVIPESVINVSKTAEGSWDRTITWTLDKTVAPDSHTGGPGDVFNSDWTVTATKTEVEGNYEVSGEIEITYANNSSEAVNFTVEDVLDDGTVAVVTCPSLTMPAGTADVITCSYTASPGDADALTNTATVVLPETLPEDFILDEALSDLSATVNIDWEENVIGDEEVDLLDDEGPLDEQLTDSDSFTYPGTFECPTDLGLYDEDGQFTDTVVNLATLTGDEGTDLEATAEVTINCALVFQGETVTGAGENWSEVGATRRDRTNTWFQYTPEDDSDAYDLVQGRKLNVVGEVEIVDNGDGTTTLSFSFEAPWQLQAVAGNVKIEPLDAAPTTYIAPGQFSYHFTKPSEFGETSSDFSVTVSTASYGYAIHLDAGYWVTG